MTYSKQHLDESIEITRAIDPEIIENIVDLLAEVKSTGGRLFVLGVGGSAANASHAVNDFRKLAGIETYAPTDNVAELTARTNDEGWQTVFSGWLKVSKLSKEDCLFILSVGGGSKERNISPNLIEAIDLAKLRGARITGIVGRDGGYTAKHAEVCLIVPTINPETVTPHSESLQAVVWHLLVSHPKLKENQTKWESAVKK
jgi:D-sedoheptulose 7-phosphate isomerase